ncbi:response regulator transcription factor [Lysinibacillus sphaericus]|uniref:Response regulator transcription factor n=1 Tax=Lysinibacillus sphaericus TaxID=1421 RepID=A0A544UAA6_LYSSH|nr:response regulator transcription factor [Lysinibacillus sp. SDF0037]TQR29096.1 response regulator transcription factor [Lysinibacillus sp. SDF0037]
MYKLMHIEDDTELSALIQENLERYGYTVVQLKDFFDIDENASYLN